MCGRNALFLDRRTLEARFDAELVVDGGYTPRYNVAPGDRLEVVTNEAPGEIDRFHWGLIPEWADAPTARHFNARAESVAEKPLFERASASRPCLVLSSGFYEWDDANRPHRIYREDGAFAMAGLWRVWRGDDGLVACVTVLTTEANETMRPIHDRMPVVLPPDAESEWLTADPGVRSDLCRPFSGDLTVDPISTRVNDTANDDPNIIEPLGHEQTGLGEFG
ncbi:MAG: SOS response-associated peptidase [Halobacteriaceae archaeon]